MHITISVRNVMVEIKDDSGRRIGKYSVDHYYLEADASGLVAAGMQVAQAIKDAANEAAANQADDAS